MAEKKYAMPSDDRNDKSIDADGFGLCDTDLDKGVKLQSNRSHTEAVEAFTRFLTSDPLHIEALLRRGESFRALGLFDLSSEDFMTVRELRSNRSTPI